MPRPPFHKLLPVGAAVPTLSLQERRRGDLTYKLVVGVNAVLAVSHIFWAVLGTVSVLPAFYNLEFLVQKVILTHFPYTFVLKGSVYKADINNPERYQLLRKEGSACLIG